MMVMITVLMSGCSTDDAVNFESMNTVESAAASLTENEELPACADAAALGGSATLSSYTGWQVVFEWNNDVAHAPDKNYSSYIEIKADAYCPPPAGAAPVAATYPIDVFNTSSKSIASVSAKCFYWRIVVNGYTGSNLDCTSATAWMPATYIQ